MKVLAERPPNYDKIVAAIPAVADTPYGIFTYGDTIYYPAGDELPTYKLAHENVHRAQQLEVGVEWWWDTYLADKAFRLAEETPAYQMDYRAFCHQHKDRNQRNDYLDHLASDLAGPLYGNLIKKSEAKKLIKS